MTLLQQLNQWSIRHHQRWFVVLRVGLGLGLIIKGIQFIKNKTELEQFIHQSAVSENFQWLNTFIPWLHLLGGSMLLAGLFTRLSALLQIPILIGAVFFVNAKRGIFAGESDLLFSVIILLLLLFFLLEGGGPYSLDNGLRKQKI